jgi:hypothetical protein
LSVLINDKAKPAERQGRKATGFNETAGLPIKVIWLFCYFIEITNIKGKV